MGEIETASKAEVLRYFFEGKVRDTGAENRFLYQKPLAIKGDQNFCAAVQSGWPLDDDNAVVGWTVGTVRFNRSSDVSMWTKTDVEVGTIYSKGIDKAVGCMLDVVKGNLNDLAQMIRPHADWASQHRFHFDREPEDDFRIIGVRHTSPKHNGTVELLDGSHRLVAMAVQGKTTVKAYIAELKSE